MKRPIQPDQPDADTALTRLERDLIDQAPAARHPPPADLVGRIQSALPPAPARTWHPLLLLPVAAAAAAAAFLLWSAPPAPTPQAPSAVASTPAPSLPTLPALEAPLHRELAQLTSDATRTVSLLRSTLSLPHRALARPH